ncbi:hypothetical protein F4813DRAFT_384665 [Daldinia decipiens]|uniref:uncharacterized protein n=1 Tax=Daldinia decipiens TaxID=326647 RepID=UPI0020C1D1A7|nr:uncharacterized protein F4813DRAFT_384665 [Daldinia decipiens]KAI1663098.1 hypothetical protein F4813DRAFT_384665 [Daldinia decipiens]
MHYFNVTNTAKFLSCTSTALTPVLTPVTKTTLSPVTQTRYTTVYETVMPAACETGQWMATYTVTETCTGKPSDYVPSVIPPGFVVTTVSCPVCHPATAIEITCPGVQPTGYPTVGITGNGVTATITATPAGYPVGNSGPYPTKVPSRPIPAHPIPAGPGSCSGPGPCPGTGPKPTPVPCAGPECPDFNPMPCSGPGCPHPGSEYTPSGNPSSPPCHGPECPSTGSGPVLCSGPGCPAPAGPGSMSCSGPGPCPGTGPKPVPVPCAGPSCPGSGNNGTTSTPPYVVSGASSLKNAFAVVTGLVFVAGHFILL